MQNAVTVDDYINSAPSERQPLLKQIRRLILTTVPQAEESMSYGMPYYSYQGRLAYFAYAKNHIGLYIPPPIIEQHKDDLSGYTISKSAVQIPYGKDIPVALITKLLKARITHNREQLSIKNKST